MVEKRLFHSVVERITDLIEDGSFPPGTRLPSERELAERLGVSRVTIRDAEIALQAIGRLEIKTSSGVYVSSNSSDNANRIPIINAFELTEARLLFEPEAAALAAINISDEELNTLNHLIDEMLSPDVVLASNADEQFHLLVARASDNRAVIFTIETLFRLREQVPELKCLYDRICTSDSGHRATEHCAILDGLRAHDPVAAREAMQAHFRRLLVAMLEVSEQQALEDLQRRSLEIRQRFLAPAEGACS